MHIPLLRICPVGHYVQLVADIEQATHYGAQAMQTLLRAYVPGKH